MSEDTQRLVEAVTTHRKYRNVSHELVDHIVNDELRKSTSPAEKVKAARDKIHQVACAYQEQEPRYGRWLTEIRAAFEQRERATLIDVCRKVMRHHASTRERLPILSIFYAQTVPDWPPNGTVVDIGCGLNPLAIPLLRINTDTEYYAYDVLVDLIDFLNSVFPMLGVSGKGSVCDVAHSPARVQRGADLALLLKIVPSLEQIQKGAAIRLITALEAKRLVVSFPVHTIGGSRKGMGKTYEDWFTQVIDQTRYSVQRFLFPTELAFVLTRHDVVDEGGRAHDGARRSSP